MKLIEKEMLIYCMGCKEKVLMTDLELGHSKRSNRYFARSNCPVCGSKAVRMLSLSALISDCDVKPNNSVDVKPDEAKWIGYCRNCDVEKPVVDLDVATLWDGRKVVHGQCTGCGLIVNVLNARLVEEVGNGTEPVEVGDEF